MKKYVQSREGAKAVGEKIANWEIGEFGFCVEILNDRTPQQNKGIHLYCTWLAKALNDKGLTVHMEYLGKTVDMPFSMEWVKEHIWRPAMEILTGHTSTTKLHRDQISPIYDVLNRHFIETHDIYVPFPDRNEPPHTTER